MNIRVRLFWVKMISGNHFPPNPHVWLSRKMIFSGKWLPVDQYFHLWPGNDFPPLFSLQIISGKRERERRESPDQREREREERAQIREREREKREPRSRRSSDNHTTPTSGAIDDRDRWDRAVRSSIELRDQRARSSDAHRSSIDERRDRYRRSRLSSDDRTDLASARCRLHRAISSSPPPDLIHFLLLRFVSFAEFDAFSVKMFEWTKHQN